MRLSRNALLSLWWAGLALAGGALAALPGLASLRELDEEIETLRGKFDRSENGEATLRGLRTELASLTAEVEARVTPIPADSDVAALIRRLSERLDSISVVEREITTGTPTAGDGVSTMPMAVSIDGPFLSAYESVRWIESLPRLVRIQRLKIEEGREKDHPPGTVSAELALEVFFAPEGGVPAGTVAEAEGAP